MVYYIYKLNQNTKQKGEIFMRTLVSLLLSLGLWVNPLPEVASEVDRTEDGDWAVTYVYVGEDSYKFDIPQEYFNNRKADGEDLDVDYAVGTFYGNYNMTNADGEEEYYYQFKSYDDEVWWCLTLEDMGFVPERGADYMLVYYQNETTKETHKCPDEYECDCYCYDDIYLGVYEL